MNKVFKYIGISLLLAGSSIGTAEARSLYWEQKTTLFDKLPIGQDDIVFLGNSITDGGEWTELFSMGNIKNRGISGDVISGVRERLAQVTDGKPAKIFLLIGINDVSKSVTAEEIARQYEELVKEIRTATPETELYIQSIMPINNDFGRYKGLIGTEPVVKELQSLIPEIAKRNGAEYIDLWPVLAEPETGKLSSKYTNDGLHLTGEGYAAWASAIEKYVKSPNN